MGGLTAPMKIDIVRRMTERDYGYLARACHDTPRGADSLPPGEVLEYAREGRLEGLILDVDGQYRALLAYHSSAPWCNIYFFYRTGPAREMVRDCRRLWEAFLGEMRARDVRFIVGYVLAGRAECKSLLRLYKRFGFAPDLLRVSKEIDHG